MKRFLQVIVLVLTVSGGTWAQSSDVVAVFDQTGTVLDVNGAQSSVAFTFQGTAGDLDFMELEAAKYANYMTLDVDHSVQGDDKPCVLSFDHVIDIRYIHKMFLSFGIEKFKYAGDVHDISEIPNVLY